MQRDSIHFNQKYILDFQVYRIYCAVSIYTRFRCTFYIHVHLDLWKKIKIYSYLIIIRLTIKTIIPAMTTRQMKMTMRAISWACNGHFPQSFGHVVQSSLCSVSQNASPQAEINNGYTDLLCRQAIKNINCLYYLNCQ